MSIKNIVLFGQTGAGKSSIVNLMAGQEMAETSNGSESCTLHWKEHLIDFDEYQYKVFDTVGLEEHKLRSEEYFNAIVNAHNLIAKLDNEGGIDLLLFCVRAGRVTAAMKDNYLLFCEWLCEKKVPIALILTGLERERSMEDWWDRNEHILQKYDIHVTDHACITAIKGLDGHLQRYEASRRLVRDLVIKHTHRKDVDAWKGGEGWFSRFVQMLKGLLLGNSTPNKKSTMKVLTNAVVCVGTLQKSW